jgi:hypothetical protein
VVFWTGAIQTAFEFFAGRAATGFIIPEWLPTLENLQYHSAVARLDAAVYGIIDACQQELAMGREPEVNIIHHPLIPKPPLLSRKEQGARMPQYCAQGHCGR